VNRLCEQDGRSRVESQPQLVRQPLIPFQVFLVHCQNIGTLREVALRVNQGEAIMNEFGKLGEAGVDCPNIAGLSSIPF
jgi:hypothetical protein